MYYELYRTSPTDKDITIVSGEIGPNDFVDVLKYVQGKFDAGFHYVDAKYENEIIFRFIKNSDIGTHAIWRPKRKK